jgi:hypothetical protein
MSRRRAIGLISGTVVAGRFLRPGSSAAAGINCSPPDSQKCAHPGGAAVCVEPDWHCCISEKCAAACPPWKKCGPVGCDDTPAICTDTRSGKATGPQYYSTQVPVQDTYCYGSGAETVGWCCRAGERKGPKINDCLCPGGVCGNQCCKQDRQYCDSSILFPDECKDYCNVARKVRRCGWECCVADKHCGGSECECNSPLVSCGTGCCDPAKTVRDPKVKDNFWDGWFNTLSATSATHGGNSERSVHTAASAGGAQPALLAIAAVRAQGAVAIGAITDGHHDSAYTRKVVAAKPSRARLAAGPGLDAGSAAALDALLAAEARAYARIAAGATALARSRAAAAKHDRAAATRQLRASAGFAESAAKILAGVPALRARVAAAMAAGAKTTLEVIVTPAEATAAQAGLRRGGVPADLRAQIARLGVTGAQMSKVRSGCIDKNVTANRVAGPVLVAPFSDAAKTALARNLRTELSAYARRARGHRIR